MRRTTHGPYVQVLAQNLIFYSFLCLPKETNQRKGTPDKVFNRGMAFQKILIIQTAPGEVNAPHLFGGCICVLLSPRPKNKRS